ncbi:hypothetical protein BLA60_21105 [Actinophytocola xinjiangensis]|uniref:PPM-type phosphatase domain-containing protein n=1 Tax=Actinophytocola xinjiangensis TaxID=485602 RepID=A0A7Z1AY51_9PSEU|nr:hypothetical protein BLA60_21105 [Actinophytocola xinjiangensis]
MWIERVPGLGEDADPLIMLDRRVGRGLLGVFDGLGGTGRESAGPDADGVDHTQAWVASRRVRELVARWFGDDLPVEELRPLLSAGLRENVHDGVPHELPTTLAAVDYRLSKGRVDWEALWAGDSRCYLADPEHGLQQLTQDDTEESDALTLLLTNPPMFNMVCLGREFTVNRWRGRATLPGVLVAATDGFFGYVDTPALFEDMLWQTLGRARDVGHWAELLATRVRGYSADDASIAVVALGFPTFEALREDFEPRARHMRTEHGQPLRAARARGAAALDAARVESWRRYQADHERQWQQPADQDD